MPQQHTCLTCGFLMVGGREVSSTDRQALVTEQAPADAAQIRCYLELWDEFTLAEGLKDVRREAQTPRTCAGHFAHTPGRSPKQHLVSSVQRQRARPQWQVATVVGVLLAVGALLARSCA